MASKLKSLRESDRHDTFLNWDRGICEDSLPMEVVFPVSVILRLVSALVIVIVLIPFPLERQRKIKTKN